jgi:hypothetical protein
MGVVEEKMAPPGPSSSHMALGTMSRTCGPQDIISLVIPRLGDNKKQVKELSDHYD